MTRAISGSVTKTGDGRWRVYVSAGFDPVSGERLRITRRVQGSRKQAEKVKEQLMKEAGTFRHGASMSVGDFFEDMYLPHCDNQLRAVTAHGYRQAFDAYINPWLGQRKLGDLTPYDITRWLEAIEKPGAALKAYKTLRQALSRAVKWRVIHENVAKLVDQPKVPKYQAEVLTVDEANALLDKAVGSPIEAAIVLALGAGLRRSEISALDWSDISDSAVHVHRSCSMVKGELIMSEPKSDNSDRLVTLPEWADQRLKEIRTVGNVTAVGPVLSHKGVRMTPNLITKAYTELTEGDTHRVPFKNLRHTHATIALASGVNVVAVSRRLGHSNVTITDKFYLKPLRSADEDAAEKFNDALGRGVVPNGAKSKSS